MLSTLEPPFYLPSTLSPPGNGMTLKNFSGQDITLFFLTIFPLEIVPGQGYRKLQPTSLTCCPRLCRCASYAHYLACGHNGLQQWHDISIYEYPLKTQCCQKQYRQESIPEWLPVLLAASIPVKKDRSLLGETHKRIYGSDAPKVLASEKS